MPRVVLFYPESDFPIFGSMRNKRVKLAILPPLGPLYLAANLKRDGFDVAVVDFNAAPYSLERLQHYLKGADAAGITIQSFNLNFARRLIQDIRRVAPDLPVAVGGPEFTLRPRPFPLADLTVAGEAERTISEIFDKLIHGGDLSTIPGAVLPAPTATGWKMARPIHVEEELDSLPFPLRDALVPEVSYDLFGKKYGRLIASVLTSRGCPYRCRFCAHNSTSFRTFRFRSADNILAELEELWNQGYRVIGFVDDTFTIPKKRAMAVMKGIVEAGWDFVIALQTRVDQIDETLVAWMHRAGVRAIVFGLESGNPDTLAYYRKGTTVEQNRRAVELCEKYGIVSVGDFILGAPMETREHIENTIRFALSTPLDLATFWALEIPYGSPLWEEARAMGAVKEDEFIATAGKERGLGSFYSWEVEAMAEEAFRRFYRRPGHWLRFARKALRDKKLRPWFLRALRTAVYLQIRLRFGSPASTPEMQLQSAA